MSCAKYDQLVYFLDDFRDRTSAILFECIAGSRAYGTSFTGSDVNIRGIFAVPAGSYLDLNLPSDQVGEDHGNVVYYSLRRVIQLLTDANPNTLELLYMPDDCVRKTSAEMQVLIAQRGLFISKRCVDTHVGYAMSEIKKAKGQNKWINNPKLETPPVKEDFCFVIPWQAESQGHPMRPIPLRTIASSLAEYHVARLEHTRDIYRLYHYGSEARGVFRGDVIVCEPIPEEDERSRFAGLLLYNEQGWRQALADHRNYWTCRGERNDGRSQQQECGELDFDAKNMMHTVRLLLSGKSLMESGRPIIRFEGDQLALLMSIREGKLSFDEIMSIAQDILADCERLKTAADMRESCDVVQATTLLREITEHWESRRQ
jgi:predicted nucleotidyltransferase